MGRNSQKKHAALGHPLAKSKLKKDPGIPRLPDLKLKQAFKHHSDRKPPRPDGDVQMAAEPSLLTLVSHEEEEETDPQSDTPAKRHYVRTLFRVIDQADVILLVLDARDPEGCRSRIVEEEVRRRELDGKRLMFVLNKIDLVPRPNAEAWLRYLRHAAPTIPFRASTQQQRANITSKTASLLMNALKSSKTSARPLTVGVVGYPNVGKSSIINSLKRAKVCAVASEPGWTKDIQAVQVERGIKLIDSPGVVFDTRTSEEQNVLLRNVLKVDDLRDPISVAELIFQRTTPFRMLAIYDLPQASAEPDFQQFLVQLSLTTGRLAKSGVPDVESTARSIIRDWNSHKIPFSSEPPKMHSSSIPGTTSGDNDVGQSALVIGFDKPFEIEGLWEPDAMEEDRDMMVSDDLTPVIPDKRPYTPTPPPPDALPFLEDVNVEREPPQKRRRATTAEAEKDVDISMDVFNPMSRKTLRKQTKTSRKKQRRSRDTQMELTPS